MNRDNDKGKILLARTMIVALSAFVLLCLLIVRLYYLQVIDGEKYKTLSDENRISTRVLIPPRGRVYDRNGEILASNEQNFQALIIAEQTPDIDATLEIISLSEDIGRTIRMNFIESVLRELAEKHNMRFSYDKDFVALGTRNLNYKDICFKLHGYDKCYFQIQNERTTVYYGIVADGYPESLRNVVGPFEDWTDGVSINWPYGSKYFPGNLRWWDGTDSLTDMVKGTKIKDIIDNALTRIIEYRLIEKYSELMDSRVANDNQTEA